MVFGLVYEFGVTNDTILRRNVFLNQNNVLLLFSNVQIITPPPSLLPTSTEPNRTRAAGRVHFCLGQATAMDSGDRKGTGAVSTAVLGRLGRVSRLPCKALLLHRSCVPPAGVM